MKKYWISLGVLCAITMIAFIVQVSAGIFSILAQRILSGCLITLLFGNCTSFMTWLACQKGEMEQTKHTAVIIFLYLCINLLFLAMTSTYAFVGLLAF